MKTALVCGAGGFIGGHLVHKLKDEGYWVRGVDLYVPEFRPIPADEFYLLDLAHPAACNKALRLGMGEPFDEVYQLAADMGGMGFISSHETDIMYNNVLINANMINEAALTNVGRYFFSSSVCVYRDMEVGEPALSEEDAVPANPDNEYGWEKLFAERMIMAYGREAQIPVRIARFQNCYGPYGTWMGGREKAPAAICRKFAETQIRKTNEIEVWGDGTAVRSYTYVTDMVDGIFMLMQSDLEGPVNIGSPEYHSVNDLVDTLRAITGLHVSVKHVDGPVGVQSRNFSNERIYKTGWRARYGLIAGLRQTYPWVLGEAIKYHTQNTKRKKDPIFPTL